MPVQVTPYEGSKLSQLTAQGAQLNNRREGLRLQDVALGQRQQSLDQEQDRFEQTQKIDAANVTKEQRFKAAEIVQSFMLEVGEDVSSLPEGQKAAAFQAKMAPILQQYGEVLDPQFANSVANAKDEHFSPQALSAAQKTFNDKISGFSPEDQVRARRIDAGLDPRAVGASAKVQMIGGVPYIFDSERQEMVVVEVEGRELNAGAVAQDAGTVEAGKAAGKAAIAQSGEAIKSLGAIKASITNIDDAIAAIDEGAETGFIMSKLPSVRTASIKLDNLQGKLGLDVVGATTFGALSKGELDLAMSTALPTDLDGPELRSWLINKREAQEALAGELERAAVYLGKPGNTPAGYLESLNNQTRTEFPRKPKVESKPDRSALEAEAKRRGLI